MGGVEHACHGRISREDSLVFHREKGVIGIEMLTRLEGLAPRRTASGMTQKELAEALGVERGTVSMWEIGRSWPPARLLPAISDVLQCSIDDLYVGAAEGATVLPCSVPSKGTAFKVEDLTETAPHYDRIQVMNY